MLELPGKTMSSVFQATTPTVIALAAFLSQTLDVQPADGGTRPNILLIMTDDQGYWDTGIAGNEDIDTPQMDALATSGTVLNRFYVSPVCSLTRAGMMTGRYYLRTGLYNTRFGGDSLGLEERTVAELLKKAGYRTGLFGKWHLGKYEPYQPQNRGFDQFFGHYHGHIERYSFPDQLVHNGRPVEARGYVTDLFTDAAIEFIRSTKDRPFFCYLAYNAPHSPFLLDTSHYGQPEGDKLLAKYLKRGLALREARIYAMIERIDANLGRLLTSLDEQGLAENTLVIFMSDNGGVSRHFRAGLRGAKGGVFEGGVRVPFFARWPKKIPAGVTLESQATHVDLLPTFCELAGVDVPDDRPIDGKSLVTLLTSGKEQPHQPYVYHTWDRYEPNPDRRWAVSDGRYKLCCQVRTGGTASRTDWHLFDLKSDPGERKNLRDERPELVEKLRNQFLTWYGDVTEGQDYKPVPIPVGQSKRPVEIQPSWATWTGPHVNYTFDGYDWDTIDTWQKPGEKAVWTLDVARPGQYDVHLAYGCSAQDAGGTLRLGAGRSTLKLETASTPTPTVFHKKRVGTLKLRQGKVKLTAEAVDVPGRELMHLNRIWLTPID